MFRSRLPATLILVLYFLSFTVCTISSRFSLSILSCTFSIYLCLHSSFRLSFSISATLSVDSTRCGPMCGPGAALRAVPSAAHIVEAFAVMSALIAGAPDRFSRTPRLSFDPVRDRSLIDFVRYCSSSPRFFPSHAARAASWSILVVSFECRPGRSNRTWPFLSDIALLFRVRLTVQSRVQITVQSREHGAVLAVALDGALSAPRAGSGARRDNRPAWMTRPGASSAPTHAPGAAAGASQSVDRGKDRDRSGPERDGFVPAVQPPRQSGRLRRSGS